MGCSPWGCKESDMTQRLSMKCRPVRQNTGVGLCHFSGTTYLCIVALISQGVLKLRVLDALEMNGVRIVEACRD